MDYMKAASPSDIAREVHLHVSEGIRMHVTESAQKLECQPDALSGNIKTRTSTIGIVGEFARPNNMNLILHQILDGIMEACVHYGQRAIVCPIANWDNDLGKILELSNGIVDGFILLGACLSEESASQIFHASPVISIHNVGALSDGINIDIDNELGAYESTKYLIGQGHTRIAHMTGDRNRAGAEDRLNGYYRALSDSGINIDHQLVVEGLYTRHSGEVAADELFKRFDRNSMPSAVFCASDYMAWGAISYFKNHGLDVPKDISVVGFDDAKVKQEPWDMDLTTVRQPLSSMGVYAMSYVLKAIDQGSGTTTELRTDVDYPNREINERVFVAVSEFGNILFFPPQLVVKNSVSTPRIH